jgi:translocator assembly and maintenance protein 41
MSGGRDIDYSAILTQFPRVSFAFAYGSGVFEQQQQTSSSSAAAPPLVDLIFAVEDADTWHRENILNNADHYAWWLRATPLALGVSQLQQNAVFFNPFVAVGNVVVKYGVVQRDELLRDLLTWSSVYVAGRLHKPVRIIRSVAADDTQLQAALQSNLAAALRVALHGAPAGRLADVDLFQRIAALSYTGDVRMRLAENPNKVRNIVLGPGNADRFRRLYEPHIERYVAEQRYGTVRRVDSNSFEVVRPITDAQRATYVADLPSELARVGDDKLARIVARSSREQTIRNAMASGLFRSVRYLAAKMLKRFR